MSDKKKKKTINLLDWRKYPSQCKNKKTREDEGCCFYIENVTNSVKYVAGTYIDTAEAKKLSKNKSWTVKIRAPKEADFKPGN